MDRLKNRRCRCQVAKFFVDEGQQLLCRLPLPRPVRGSALRHSWPWHLNLDDSNKLCSGFHQSRAGDSREPELQGSHANSHDCDHVNLQFRDRFVSVRRSNTIRLQMWGC